MGRECVVPYCLSTIPKKVQERSRNGVSFHELSADLEQRRLWLKAISRASDNCKQQEWIPSDDQ